MAIFHPLNHQSVTFRFTASQFADLKNASLGLFQLATDRTNRFSVLTPAITGIKSNDADEMLEVAWETVSSASKSAAYSRIQSLHSDVFSMQLNRIARSSLPAPRVMASPDIEHFRSKFLDGLTKQEVHSILSAAILLHYPADTILANQSDPADYFFLLKTGSARLFYLTPDGGEVLLRWLRPGEILGVAALLYRPEPYLVGTEVLSHSSAFVWRRKTIRDLVVRYPKLSENALPFASDHLTWFIAAHVALISKTARERLANVLLTLADGFGCQDSRGVRLNITNEELANAANVTPFTVSRLLSEWQRSGIVVKTRGAITVCAASRLFQQRV